MKSIRFEMVLFVLALLSLALGACGAGGSPQPSAGANGSSNATTANDSSAGEAPAETVELTISAAASLTDALHEIQALYEARHPGVKLAYNFGASGALQRQIEQGAPADLFFSAAASNMEALEAQGLIDAGHRHNLLANELVVVVPADGGAAPTSEEELTGEDVKRIAIGIPESVPAGSYAKEALAGAGLWDELQPKLVQAKDVRQVLQYVETGNADAGIVYRTDALSSDAVSVAFAVRPDSYAPILYPVGIVEGTKHAAAAESLFTYLQSDEALAVFVQYGFAVPA